MFLFRCDCAFAIVPLPALQRVRVQGSCACWLGPPPALLVVFSVPAVVVDHPLRWCPAARSSGGSKVLAGLARAELGVHLPLRPLQLVLSSWVPDDVAYGEAAWVVTDVVGGMVVWAWPWSLGEVC